MEEMQAAARGKERAMKGKEAPREKGKERARREAATSAVASITPGTVPLEHREKQKEKDGNRSPLGNGGRIILGSSRGNGDSGGQDRRGRGASGAKVGERE